MTDTPNTFDKDKILRSSENGLFFDIIRWGEIDGRPDRTKAAIEGAVDKAHEHGNSTSLGNISENNGILTYKGIKYVPESALQDYIHKDNIGLYLPQKKKLQAVIATSSITISRGNFIRFPAVYENTIQYNSSTGIFTLEIDKTYEISVILLADVNDYIKFYLAKEDKSKKYYPLGTLYGQQTSKSRGSSGNLHMLFTPTATTGTKFGILLGSDSSSQDDSVKFIYEECGLMIKEI